MGLGKTPGKSAGESGCRLLPLQEELLRHAGHPGSPPEGQGTMKLSKCQTIPAEGGFGAQATAPGRELRASGEAAGPTWVPWGCGTAPNQPLPPVPPVQPPGTGPVGVTTAAGAGTVLLLLPFLAPPHLPTAVLRPAEAATSPASPREGADSAAEAWTGTDGHAPRIRSQGRAVPWGTLEKSLHHRASCQPRVIQLALRCHGPQGPNGDRLQIAKETAQRRRLTSSAASSLESN